MNSTTIPVFNPDLPIHMTFEELDWHLLAQYWYPVALARDVSEQPLGTMLLDMSLVIYKMQDELIVAKDACPHRGVPLSLGKMMVKASSVLIMACVLVHKVNVTVSLHIHSIKFQIGFIYGLMPRLNVMV